LNLQDGAQQNARNADKAFWTMLFFVFTRILFPIIKHSIKHKWIFVILGFVAPFMIHGMLASSIFNFNHLLAIPIYAILIPLGIYTTIRMRQHDKMKMYRYGSPTNPRAPKDLYSDEG